jgi:hypothetical protein
MEERLCRRWADQNVLDTLAKDEFTGRLYDRFTDELARYGIAVLRAWMHSGHIFRLTGERGYLLKPTEHELEELNRDSDTRDQLAVMTVALALPRFRNDALIGRRWTVEGGASLPTYFMGACLYVFPNEFGKLRVQRRKWSLQDHRDIITSDLDGHRISDPGVLAVGNLRVTADLERLDPHRKAIITMKLLGYSYEEIVEILEETSVRAVEGVVHRWRTGEKQRLTEGVTTNPWHPPTTRTSSSTNCSTAPPSDPAGRGGCVPVPPPASPIRPPASPHCATSTPPCCATMPTRTAPALLITSTPTSTRPLHTPTPTGTTSRTCPPRLNFVSSGADVMRCRRPPAVGTPTRGCGL